MKSKRLLSMLLSMIMVVSCLFTTPLYAVASDVEGFTNIVVGGDMEGELNWNGSTSVEGEKVSIVTDSADGTNKVLRFDGTEITSGTTSYMAYSNTTIPKGTKYYYSYKIRLADADTNTIDLYAYTNLNPSKMPKLSTEWTTQQGVRTATTDAGTAISFKAVKSQSFGDNRTSAIYEVDNVVVYYLNDAKTITLPADATIASTDSVLAVSDAYYAMPGTVVSVTYEKEGYDLLADGAALTNNGATYTFIVGDSDVTISEFETAPSTEFENLVADSTFDGALDTNVWAMSTSAEGVITPVKDTKDETNNVLRIDCSENTKNISYVNYNGVTKGTYYMSVKVRLAETDATTDENHYLYAAALSGIGNTKYWNVTKPAINKDGWTECYGVFTVTEDTKKLGFKIINTQNDQNKNVAKAVYEIDDFVVYNLKNAKNITVPADVTFTSDNVVKSHNGTYYAVSGSEVSFTYEKAGYTVVADGAELTKNGTTYTFTVDSSDVTISEVELKTEFENLVADPGFDGALDTNVWAMSTSAEGVITPVKDTKDETNNVLRIDCSENTKNISYVNYNGVTKGTYYMSVKVRLAETDATTDENHYLYAAALSGIGNTKYWNVTKPAINKDGWTECYGVFTVTEDTKKLGFKIINTQNDQNKNVAKAVYEIDDFVIYNLENAQNITAPAEATFTGDNVVKSHNGTYYAMIGSEVSFTYEKDGYYLVAEGAELVNDGNTYTFTVDDSTVTISEVEEPAATIFENLVADPGFDGALDTNVWAMSTSAEGVITPVKDTKDETNNVLRIDCSENTKNISYVNYNGVTKGTYYMSLKVRLAETDATTDENHYLYAAILGGIGNPQYWNVTKPAINKDGWAECYGVFTVTEDTKKLGFKIINTQDNQNKNVAKAVYEFDDFVVYSLDNAKNIVAPADVTFISDNVVKSHNDTYYAVSGSEVSFTYEKEGYAASVEGADFINDGNTYTFTVGDSAVTISEIDLNPATEFENLVVDSTFDGALDPAVWVMSSSAEGVITIEEDTKDETNNVLRVDCSENNKDISYVNYKSVPAGTYYMSLKVRLAETDATTDENHFLYAAALGGIGEMQFWDTIRPSISKDGWAECYGVFTVSGATNSIGFKITKNQGDNKQNVAKAVYEIDDFILYSLDNAQNIAAPAEATITSDNVVKSHDTSYYAMSGNDVTFTYDGEGLEALYINGEVANAVDNVYTCSIEDKDVLVLAIANQQNESTVKYAVSACKPYAIFEEDATVMMIAAHYAENGALESLYNGTVTAVAGQSVDLSEVDGLDSIKDWTTKTIFTWDGLTDITPIRSSFGVNGL